MERGKYVYTPRAIRDFREIYATEKLTRLQAVEGLRSSLKGARLELTQADGGQILRSTGTRQHYLLIGDEVGGSRQVKAVGSTLNDLLGELPNFGAHPGAELRFARETLGISLEELAELVRLPRRRLEAWERGQFRSWRSLRQLARLVGKLHETRILTRAMRASGAGAPDRLAIDGN